MNYKVVEHFTDLQDNGHAYSEGDTFPRKGFSVSDERLAELASANNKRGMVLIEKAKKAAPTKEKAGDKITSK